MLGNDIGQSRISQKVRGSAGSDHKKLPHVRQSRDTGWGCCGGFNLPSIAFRSCALCRITSRSLDSDLANAGPTSLLVGGALVPIPHSTLPIPHSTRPNPVLLSPLHGTSHFTEPPTAKRNSLPPCRHALADMACHEGSLSMLPVTSLQRRRLPREEIVKLA